MCVMSRDHQPPEGPSTNLMGTLGLCLRSCYCGLGQPSSRPWTLWKGWTFGNNLDLGALVGNYHGLSGPAISELSVSVP